MRYIIIQMRRYYRTQKPKEKYNDEGKLFNFLSRYFNVKRALQAKEKYENDVIKLNNILIIKIIKKNEKSLIKPKV